MGTRKNGEENNDREKDEFGCNEIMAKDKIHQCQYYFLQTDQQKNCKEARKLGIKKMKYKKMIQMNMSKIWALPQTEGLFVYFFFFGAVVKECGKLL